MKCRISSVWKITELNLYNVKPRPLQGVRIGSYISTLKTKADQMYCSGLQKAESHVHDVDGIFDSQCLLKNIKTLREHADEVKNLIFIRRCLQPAAGQQT